jgi:GLPGLI family protein
MKKFNTLAILMAMSFLMLSFTAFSKDFKGVVTYKVTVTGSQVTDEVKAMMPKTMVLTIKGNKSRSEMVMGMGKTVAISNAETKESIALIDMMGQKIAVKSTPEEIQEEINGSPKITVETTAETKDILGYTCNKAIIKSDEGTQIIVYYTKALGTGATYFDDPQFKDISGLMLEFEIPSEGMSMKFTAITVESKSVEDSEFNIPEGYQIKTKEEMKGMFGGGM